MTTSGTRTFDPTTADIFADAYERCGIMPPSLNQHMLESARRSLNLLFREWDSRGPHQWSQDEQSVALSAADGTYDAAAGTVDVLYAYVRDSNSDDRLLARISRSEWAGYANKDATSSSGPTVYYVDRVTGTPVITVWPALATGASALTLRYIRLVQLADITGTISQTADVAARALEAMCAGLAAKLAVKFAPDRFQMLDALAARQWGYMTSEDRERVPVRFQPNWGR